MFFLDANTCIYYLKGSYTSVLEEFKKHKPTEIKIPAIVKAELLLGVEKSMQRDKNQELYSRFLEPFEIVAFDDAASAHYARIRAWLEKKGQIIGPNDLIINDLIIAATVLSQKGTLVSHNTREFRNVPGLLLEDWVKL